jgi:hypothetical protein
MNEIELVLARLDGMCWRLDAGAHLEFAEIAALAAEAEAKAEAAPLADRRRILDAAIRVRDAIARSSLNVMARMEALNTGRRAATAYARGGG